MGDKIPVMRLPHWWRQDRLKTLRVVKCDEERHKTYHVHHRVEFHALVMLINGEGYFQVDDHEKHEISGGTLLSLYPGSVFRFGPHKEGDWHEFHVCFTGERVQEWLDCGWFQAKPEPRMIGEVSDALRLYKEIQRGCYSAEPGDRDRSALACERLIMEMFYAARKYRRGEDQDPTLLQAINYLRENYAEEMDWEELSEELGVSYSYLRQGVKRLTGRSPYRLLTEMRMAEAQRLLSSSHDSISMIAEQVGIPDQFTFSRTFKRLVGTPPSDFRKRMRPAGWRPREIV